MEKKQYELCVEVLRRLDKAGVLSRIILIGSWCLPFYKEYFQRSDYRFTFRTRDVDFLVPLPLTGMRKNVNIIDMFGDLGFIVERSYPSGYMKLQHPELIIEFLTPEKGRGSDKPCAIPALGINAQSLRFLSLLTEKTVLIVVEGIAVRLPEPVYFALHKLIVAGRRNSADKAEKDREAALQVMHALIRSGKSEQIREALCSLPAGWRKAITSSVDNIHDEPIKELLK